MDPNEKAQQLWALLRGIGQDAQQAPGAADNAAEVARQQAMSMITRKMMRGEWPDMPGTGLRANGQQSVPFPQPWGKYAEEGSPEKGWIQQFQAAYKKATSAGSDPYTAMLGGNSTPVEDAKYLRDAQRVNPDIDFSGSLFNNPEHGETPRFNDLDGGLKSMGQFVRDYMKSGHNPDPGMRPEVNPTTNQAWYSMGDVPSTVGGEAEWWKILGRINPAELAKNLGSRINAGVDPYGMLDQIMNAYLQQHGGLDEEGNVDYSKINMPPEQNI